MRTWRKKTGPCESSRTASATTMIGAITSSIVETTKVEDALQPATSAVRAEAADAEHRHAVHALELDGRAHDLEQRGSMLTRTPAALAMVISSTTPPASRSGPR